MILVDLFIFDKKFLKGEKLSSWRRIFHFFLEIFENLMDMDLNLAFS